ncbi:hypothetical protein H206_00970 [Candidatus Electrothrix aarhusensis]|uniref:Uncharacterized protein n=1 Tax=Candidatus Electrothrix aarhusensis TaxID=1859131 RepID=A0A444IWY2_9BACT|nr:hypothetical protein H206_00970 [Candidatus Electrothrix aarhusensis]
MICTKKTAILTLSLATSWSVNALAQPQNSISKPPLEAYTACEGKQPDENSRFVSKLGNTISGQCKQQQDGRLLLIPDQLREGKKIPPAAYQECIGKKLGDAAQVTIPTGKTISGTCQSDGDRLYLRPDSPPGMNARMHAGMKTHKEGQYQELQDGNKQPDTRQQAPDQKENDSSYWNQQQSTPPEDMHSNVQQQQPQQQAERGNRGSNRGSNTNQYQESRNGSRQSDTWQQAPPDQNEDDNPYGNQQQSTPPQDMHSNVRQQQPQQQAGRDNGRSNQSQEPQHRSRQTETRHQKPDQKEDNRSYGNNQQQQQPPQAGRGNGKPKPPETAYKSCEGKRAGEEIKLTTPQGRKITGTCEQDGDRLFLRPNRPGAPNGKTSSGNIQQNQPPRHPGQRPQEQPKGFLGRLLDKVKDFWKKLW